MQHDAITANPLDIGSLNGTYVNGQPIDSSRGIPAHRADPLL